MHKRSITTASTCVMLLLAGCSSQSDAGSSEPGPSGGASQTATAASTRESYISGAVRPEDLVSVPGTPWVLVSGMASAKLGTAGHLYSVNTDVGLPAEVWPTTNQQIEWDPSTYPGCPGPPDATEPHGINVRADEGQPPVLYAINHKRESVEVFRIDATTDIVGLIWTGCIPLPHNVYANGIAALPEGGLALTSMYDPTEPGNPFERMFTGKDTGQVVTWHRDSGWAPVPNSGLGGANGIAVTPDGRSIIAAAWTQKKVVRLPLDGSGERSEATVPFLPDNLRWTTNGTVLVTGQDISADDIMTCNGGEGTDCPTGYTVVEINPDTMASTVLHDEPDSPFSLATTALPVADEIWVGSIAGDKIARVSGT
ncbi:hypothetical protein Rwratislav_20536 [Rhodococcus wratislaviensis IFP 2016]|nr:hypothetical protein Rwratislav_20536 [Rhodococcus wratislaviensis IFP 2016]NKY76333.1 hypothetical protein [Rhodococcus opacus]CAG7580000.1 hypothetical protein E143388_00134 [Rhodococcus opacus]